MSASPCSAAAAAAPRGTSSAAGAATCPGTRSMPSAAGAGLAGHRPAVLHGRARHLAARPADQRLRPGGRPGTPLAPRRDGGCRLRPAQRRPPLPLAAPRRRLAPPPALVRGRCLLPPALDWLATARQCFTDEHGTLQRGLLTSAFALAVGLERLWHLDEMEDVGFALLSGGRRCPSRHLVGGWRRHLPWYEVDAFCRQRWTGWPPPGSASRTSTAPCSAAC